MDTQVHSMLPGLLAFTIFVLVVTVVSVSLRFWARSLASKEARRVLHLYWWDDWVALATAILVLAQLGIELHLILFTGFGHHEATLSKEMIGLLAKLLFAGTFLFLMTVAFARLSVLLFLTRIFPARNNSRWFNFTLWTCYALNGFWLAGATFAVIFTCDPVRKVYDPFVPGKCRSQFSLYLGNSAPSAAIDLVVLILPLPKVWGLQITAWKKFGLLMTFVLGYGIIVVSIGRIIGVANIRNSIDKDFSYVGVPLFFWLTAEPGISILCACLPAMLPIGRKLARSLNWGSLSFSSSSRGTVKSKSGNFISSRTDPYESNLVITRPGPEAETFWREDSSLELQGSITSSESRNDLFRPSPIVSKTYRAQARGGVAAGELVSPPVPLHSIRVERDIVVVTTEQRYI
ncbi:hypothetical protein F5Y16DRAFT_379255 [Xylariaceae sp. FL0255]|nr:hypothetical protein F5Y16DRAFT_379255 [Xylariaceae sp. FL0255]